MTAADMICSDAGVSSRAAPGAGPSALNMSRLKPLGPAPGAARDDTPSGIQDQAL
jgi:hypothetical protein